MAYEHAGDLPDADWDAVAGRSSIFLQRPVLQVFEETGPEDMVFRYGLVYAEGGPKAAVYGQRTVVTDQQLEVQSSPDSAARGFPWRTGLTALGKKARNAALGAMGRRVFACGNLFTSGPHGVTFHPESDPAAHWADALAVLQAFEVHASPGGLADFCIVKDLSAPPPAVRRTLRRAGFGETVTEPRMCLDLPPDWSSYEDYLASLRNKYRRAARKIWDQVLDAGFTFDSLDAGGAAAEAEGLHGLYRQVERHAEVRFGVLRQNHIPTLARALPPDAFRLTVIRDGARPVGFAFTIKDGDAADAHLVGFDYEANRTAPVYLRLLHQTIVHGIELGCRHIAFGRTALEPKARLGARPLPTQAWVRHRNPGLNRVVSPLLRMVPQAQAPDRHPFH